MALTEESDATTAPKRGWSLVIILVVVLPVLYVLSSGPVLKLVMVTHTFDTTWVQHFLKTFYAPLDWLYHESKWFRAFIDAYLRWCGCS